MTAMGGENLDRTDVEIAGLGGVATPMRTLYFDQTPERELHIISTPDRMRVFVRYAKLGPKPALTRDGLVGLLHSFGVKHGIIDAGVSLYTALQNSPNPLPGYFQVARGEPRRKGEDGVVEFHVQPTSRQPRYDVSEDGAIDYRQPNLIENCFAGQRVASILPPGPGRAGTNVFGEEVPPVPGKPIAIRPGPGVVVSSSGREFTSEIEGRLVYEDGVLSVSPTLEIARDIDYSVGNVDFVGRVIVHGSLLDGFYVNAKHGVEIAGDVGAARVSSEGDVTIAGGVKGKNAAIITCRSLSARYIDDAFVESTGDVEVNKEIMNSNVQALGRVSVTGGAIIGGLTCGFRGVEADTLGSEMGVPTIILSGLNWAEENKKQDIRARLAEYLDRVRSAQVLLEPLFGSPELTARLSADQKSMLSEVISELRDVRENIFALLEERARVVGRRQTGMVSQINVRKTLHLGVEARFADAEGEIKDTVKGPAAITPGKTGIRVGPLVALPKSNELEAAEATAAASAENGTVAAE